MRALTPDQHGRRGSPTCPGRAGTAPSSRRRRRPPSPAGRRTTAIAQASRLRRQRPQPDAGAPPRATFRGVPGRTARAAPRSGRTPPRCRGPSASRPRPSASAIGAVETLATAPPMASAVLYAPTSRPVRVGNHFFTRLGSSTLPSAPPTMVSTVPSRNTTTFGTDTRTEQAHGHHQQRSGQHVTVPVAGGQRRPGEADHREADQRHAGDQPGHPGGDAQPLLDLRPAPARRCSPRCAG